MKEKQNSKGITLIALVVTIIVLLILAGIGIATLTGENSIIKKATSAKGASSEAEAKEKVELEVLGSLDNEGNINKEKLKENLKDNLGVQDNQIVDPNEEGEFDDPFDFPLEDYDVRVNPNGDVEIMPKGEIPTPPTLSEGDIIFNPVPSTLTNKEVKVSIKVKVSTMRLTLQYALENPDEEDSWQTYTGPVTFKDNGPIYARLINENGEKSNYTTENVENIDKQEPTIEEFKAVEGSETTNSVKVTVSASDDRQLASKDTYQFFAQTDEGEYELNGTSTESEYTYTNLERGKSYTLKVIVADEAGNTTEKEIENEVEIQKVPDLVASSEPEEPPGESPTPGESPDPSKPSKTPNITFSYEPKSWTQEDVTVTLDTSLTEQGYILQYSLTGKGDSWQDYTPEGFTVTQNQAVFARLRDSSNQYGGTATGNVSNIDREIPSLRINVGNTTTKTIEVNLTTEDKPSGLAESEAIKYYIVEGRITNQTILETKKGEAKQTSNNKSYTFSELKQNTTYTILVEVTDKAGNVNKKSIIASTGSIPGTKPVAPGSTDTNGDGKIDGWDTDGDGKVDAWDTDGDGNADSWDDNGNGQLDEPAENNIKNGNNGRNKDGGKDTNGDGMPDTWDTNHDGKDDSWDTNKDGNADSYDRNGDGLLNDDENNSKHPEELKGRDENGGKDTNRDGKPDTWDTDGDDKDDSFDTDKDGNADSYDQNGNGELDDNENNSLHPDTLKGRDQNGGKDTNGDGKPDSWDITGDNKDDSWDTDGDGNADSWDRNKNNKLDESENNALRPELNGRDENGGRDTNKDGRPDVWDTDGDGKDDAKDNNGDLIPDEWDTDGDGKPDSWDTDVPPDGNADSFDRDGNNELDEDEDNSKHPELEGKDETGGRDTNGDGKADTWDKDENGNKAWDTDGDGKPDSWDTDGDGNADSFDKNGNNELDDNEDNSKHSDTLHGRDENGGKDNNGDGKPDSWDITGDDKDYSWDTDGDGNADSWDRNKNNTLDNNEDNSKHPELNGRDENGGRDTNKDGRPDTWDRDGDGKDDAKDTNGDGNADSFDKDHNGEIDESEDNSKHPENNERDENGGKDTNGDGKADTWDRDGDGKDDAKDTDGDGNADSFDKDHNGEIDESEDNSKHPENGGRDENNGKDTNGDGKPDTWVDPETGAEKAKDTDGDGNADSFDKNHNGKIDESEDNSKHPENNGRDENGGKDTNQDGKPDAWDTDGDGKDDSWDITDDEGNKKPDGNADSYDRDGDGELDDNEDNSKHSEELKGRDENHGKDTNGDGKPDLWDRDDNGEDDSQDTDKDGNADKWLAPDTKEWKDEDESGYRAWDTNKDGKPDAWDTNGDGKADSYDKNGNNKLDPDENSTTNPSEENNGRDKNGGRDTNGDGKPDAWDTDGDGKDDSWDTDKDGNADSYDKDKDGNLDNNENNSLHPDTLKGRDENGGKDTNGDGKPDTWDTDGDGKDDSWDTTDDEGNANPDGNADSYDKNGNGILDDDENNSKHPDELKGRDQNGGKDNNGDGRPDSWDRDENDIDDSWDKDGDGNADTYDRNWNGELEDSEDNSIHPEELKGRDENGGRDTNKDGRPDSWDTDGDNKDDAWDTDGDGDPDAWDTDEPKDGNADEWVFPSEEGIIEFAYKPETWTSDEVEVTLSSDYTPEFSIEYSTNYNPLTRQGDWQEGTKEIFKDNGNIYSRLKDKESKETGGLVKGKIDWIDHSGPETRISSSVETSDSVLLKVEAKDSLSGLADENTYKYYLIEGKVTDLEQVQQSKGRPKETSSNASYTYTGLEEDKDYTLIVDVMDKVGNVTTVFLTQKIEKIPDLNTGDIEEKGNITFNYSINEWNNEDEVTVTIELDKSINQEDYYLQYQIGDYGEWIDYLPEGFTIKNNGHINAKLKTKYGNREGKLVKSEYNWFDREIPEIQQINVTEVTTHSITVDVTAQDKPENGASGIAEENAYTYTIVKKSGGESNEIVSSESSHTFDGLTQDTEYIIKVKVKDNAQNIGEQETSQITDKIPDITQEGEIKFDFDPNRWNNKESATVSLSTKEEINESEMMLQYQTLNEKNTEWQNYNKDEKIKITTNGTINARLIEINGTQTSNTASANYKFFDRKEPTISVEAEEPKIDSVKINVLSSEDTESVPGAEDASGIAEENKYTYYKKEVGTQEEIQVYTGNDESYTYTGLLQNKEYNLRVEVVDKAGNKGSESTTITTKKIPSLSEDGTLTTTYNPDSWTNEERINTKLSSKYEEEGFKLQYSRDYNPDSPEDATWEDYPEDGFDITENGKYAVRLKLESEPEDQYGEPVEKEVDWIDRIAPNITIGEESETSTNSIKVTVSASDSNSGLKENDSIKYYIIEGTISDLDEINRRKGEAKKATNDTEFTFTELNQDTSYTIVVEVTDKAGNTQIATKVVETDKIPDLYYGKNITYKYSPSEWTNNESVTVTFELQNNVDEGFTLQYGTSTSEAEPTEWIDYTQKGFTVNENCTIYARLKEVDGSQTGSSAQNDMQLIDTTPPEGTLKITGNTTNSISVEVENPGDDLSGLHATETYVYSIYEGTDTTQGAVQTKEASTESTVKFTGLAQNKEYTVKVIIKDKAGNTSESTVTGTTGKVPDLAKGDITFNYDTNTWTNKESVKVTLTTTENVDLNTYKLQYQTANEVDTSWHDYEETGFDITNNGKIYAQLIEKDGNQTGGTATSNYEWFDKNAPNATISVTNKTSSSISVTAGYTEEESGLHDTESFAFSIYLGDAEGEVALQTKPAGTTNTATFDGLTSGVQYTVKVEVKDKASNVGKATVTETTEEIPDLNAIDFKFNYSPDTWTQSNVIVTCTPNYLTDSKYKLQIRTDSNTTWTDYEEDGYEVTINEKVYARLVERNGKEEAEEKNQAVGEVTQIDRVPPVTQITMDNNTGIATFLMKDELSGISGMRITYSGTGPDGALSFDSGWIKSPINIGGYDYYTVSGVWGTGTFTFDVQDNAQNHEYKEQTVSTTDTVPPVVSLEVPAHNIGTEKCPYCQAESTVISYSVRFTDDHSGIARYDVNTVYPINGNNTVLGHAMHKSVPPAGTKDGIIEEMIYLHNSSSMITNGQLSWTYQDGFYNVSNKLDVPFDITTMDTEPPTISIAAGPNYVKEVACPDCGKESIEYEYTLNFNDNYSGAPYFETGVYNGVLSSADKETIMGHIIIESAPTLGARQGTIKERYYMHKDIIGNSTSTSLFRTIPDNFGNVGKTLEIRFNVSSLDTAAPTISIQQSPAFVAERNCPAPNCNLASYEYNYKVKIEDDFIGISNLLTNNYEAVKLQGGEQVLGHNVITSTPKAGSKSGIIEETLYVHKNMVSQGPGAYAQVIQQFQDLLGKNSNSLTLQFNIP